MSIAKHVLTKNTTFDDNSRTEVLIVVIMDAINEFNLLTTNAQQIESNCFELMVKELLNEVKVKDKLLLKINDWIKQFESKLRSIKSSKSYQLTDQLWCKSLKVPIIQEPFEVNGVFNFETPKVIKIIGSYDLKTLIGPQIVVDLAVEIPTECWQRQDNLNHRYFRKRALYICYICQMIKSWELIGDMKFTYFNGNHMKPIVLVTPSDQHLAKRFRLSLTAYPKSDQKVYRLIRFIPEKNNVRSNWFNINDSISDDFATPIYNSSILQDMNLILNYEYLAKTVEHNQHIKEALIMLKIWLKQRLLKTEFCFPLSLFICHLIERQKINNNLNGIQIFRNTLLAISTSKWDTEGISLTDDVYESIDYYMTYFPLVFIDISGHHNLCWDITIDQYNRLRHESKLTVECLDSTDRNSFETIFIKSISFELKFDILFHICVEPLLKCSKVTDIRNDIIDNCDDIITAFVGHLVPLFRRVVDKRVSLLQHKSKSYDSCEWTVDESPPHPNDRKYLTFGLLVDEEYSYNNIERGPLADTTEAKEFKDFWGEKSELRRFQDNSICEAVYWDAKKLCEKRQIIANSLKYILSNILEIPTDSLLATTSLLDPLVSLTNLKFENKNTIYGTSEEFSIALSHRFDSLAKKLRTLDGLPLMITNIQSIDSVFRGTDVFPPIPLNSEKSYKYQTNVNLFDLLIDERVPKYFKPLKVILNLEGSGKWPDSLDAFYKVKASFYVEMAQKLSEQFGLISYANTDYVDIYEEGFVFRVIISLHKELVLLRQMTTSDGQIKRIENKLADDLENTFEVLPKINSALNALNRKHLCFGITCRLVKRFISAQMLSYYFEDIVLDLLVAYIFLNSHPYTVPNSPVCGFFRFLSLICEHNWKISPLIVNFNNELNEETISQIITKFTKDRPNYPPMFVVTAYDKQWSKWTQKYPDPIILNRFIKLAIVARNTLKYQLENPLEVNPKVIFRPDLDIYDIIIRLKSHQIPNQIQGIDFPEKYEFVVKDFNTEFTQRMPITDFHPIDKYLNLLRSCYSEFALFFYDCFGGRQIGVLWKPSVFESRSFTTYSIKGGILSSTADKSGTQNVVTNIEAIIEDFNILGEGIVSQIQVMTHNMSKRIVN
ncbi:nucleolar protein 6-like [Oppia nitens]|uniref:nucleolar protein 6-like n=1 Tax=Oppia nitens TaxID=1686743 RepID=UPI0023D9DE56|nr:nucleolar protein 6-like [Oppia nitens]